MGLYSDLDTKLKAAFDGRLADAVKLLDLTLVAQTYDPDTGEVVDTPTLYATRGVAEPVDNSMIDGEVVKIADTAFTILQSELAAAPSVGDTIVTAHNSKSYSLNTVLADPADVTWTLVGEQSDGLCSRP